MWIGEVEQLDPRRSTAEQALAEERVEGHAGKPLLLLALAGGPARLVVGDNQLAISVELEAVDAAAKADTAGLRTDGRVGGKRCVSTGRARWWAYQYKRKKTKQ